MSDIALTLQLAAWTNVLWAVGLVGVCNVIHALVVFLAIRPINRNHATALKLNA